MWYMKSKTNNWIASKEKSTGFFKTLTAMGAKITGASGGFAFNGFLLAVKVLNIVDNKRKS